MNNFGEAGTSVSGALGSITDSTTIRVMDGLRRVVRVLTTSARSGAVDGTLSGAQRFVLRQIGRAPGISIGELATRTLSRQSTVSEVVGKLVDRHLVARAPAPTDARQVTLTLTADGERLADTTEPVAQERLVDGLAALDPSLRTALADGLDAWLVAAGFADVPATMFFEEGASVPARKGGEASHA